VHTVTGYGDVLEILAGTLWIGQALATGQNPLVCPLNFFPEGWRVATHGGGPFLFAALTPLAAVGGVALAFNLAVLATHALAFGGALAVGRRYLKILPATVVALAFTFWGLRWNQAAGGRLNITLGSALLPWMVWGIEHALATPRRWPRWLAFVGFVWAVTIMCSLYFAYIGGLVVAIWVIFARPGEHLLWRSRLLYLAYTALAGLLFASPWLYINWHDTRIADPPFYSALEVNFWGASLNALPAPSVAHPLRWLRELGRAIYQGAPDWEQGTANLGLLGCAMAVAGVALALRDKKWRPMLLLAACALSLSLGLTLHWSGEPVQWVPMRPINQALWSFGHALKPVFFFGDAPPVPFQDGIPLPAYLLTVVMPFMERGRALARYALPGSLGVFLLAGLALNSIRRTWLQVILAGLLVLEIVPPRLESLPYPPPTHPAFNWLAKQSIPGEGIAEVVAPAESALVLGMSGDILLAPFFHHQRSVTGASGVAPRSQATLFEWLVQHPHPFWHPDFAAVMRFYKVRYLSMIQLGDWDKKLWSEAKANKELKQIGCFKKPAGPSPWNWDLCILEVLPAPPSNINLLLHDGFSGREDWGVWSESADAAAQWISTTAGVPYRLTWSAFPQCVPDQKQAISFQINGQVLQTHEWEDCEPYAGTLDIPASLVRVGANDVTVSARYASAPPAPASGAPADTRTLAAGFTRLLIERLPRQ
jgi:hypothetical protein